MPLNLNLEKQTGYTTAVT